jgi:hypothetical protein
MLPLYMSATTEPLSQRQAILLACIEEEKEVPVGRLVLAVAQQLGEVTRMTLTRDMETLL